MSNKLKTIPDIIAEKRRIAKDIRDYASNGDYWDKQKANEEAEEYEWDADDIEAAYKREMGNAQKMRTALEQVVELAKAWASPGADAAVTFGLIIDRAKDALSAPPRNCDMYATHNDAMKSFEAFVREKGKLGFINPYTEAFKWLFAPATKQEGESNEQINPNQSAAQI